MLYTGMSTSPSNQGSINTLGFARFNKPAMFELFFKSFTKKVSHTGSGMLASFTSLTRSGALMFKLKAGL